MHRSLRLLLPALFVLLCGHSAASAQVARLYPVDEAVEQPGFFSFRAKLLQAAQARDTEFLIGSLAPNILNSFGGDGGVAEFRHKWRPEDPDSEVWAVLTEILSLGGEFLGDTMFIAPYTTTRFPGEFDSFLHVAIVGSGVRARQRPDRSAPVMATLSFDVVRKGEAPADGRAEWVPVRLADGREAWVAAAYVRSPVGYRAGFVRRHGRWLLRSLVAGD